MAVANNNDSYLCEKCNRVKKGSEFYSSHNLEKYPNDGKMPQCKMCLTMHVDNWDPDTYLWILQEIDVPYIPEEWNKLMATFAKPGAKVSGMTILGRYLSKMQLKQFKEYRWKDSDFIQQMNNAKIEATMKKQGYSAVEIAEVIQKGTFSMPDKPLEQPECGDSLMEEEGGEDYFAGPAIDDDIGLTEEDSTYLRLKWGKAYKPEEWVWLEQLFEEMMGSYDIQSAGHIDTLKLVCKTSLKANQLLDIGDVDGAQKMIKMYDGLMKSGKFTAAQNKAESGEFVDSISEIVALCEKDGFIPRYYTDGPQDKVDKTILDMQEYTHTLVTEEMHLGELIEKALKQIEEDRLKEAELEIDDETEDEALERELFDLSNQELTDDDFADFYDAEDEQYAQDGDFYKALRDSSDEEDE